MGEELELKRARKNIADRYRGIAGAHVKPHVHEPPIFGEKSKYDGQDDE